MLSDKQQNISLTCSVILYSWKYWQELNLAVELQITILAHWLKLVVQYRIAIHIYVMKKFWWINS